MHYFVAEISLIEIGTVAVFLKRAEAIYEENLAAYVKIVLRRPFAKIIVSSCHIKMKMYSGSLFSRNISRAWNVF